MPDFKAETEELKCGEKTEKVDIGLEVEDTLSSVEEKEQETTQQNIKVVFSNSKQRSNKSKTMGLLTWI